MKQKSRTLGWLAVIAGVIWIWYDYQGRIRNAIMAGWVTLGLTAAHILTVKR